jgi:hypothetical protein
MVVNTLKTKAIILGKNHSSNKEFRFNNLVVMINNSYRYLGIVFNSVSTIRGDIVKTNAVHLKDKAIKAIFASLKKTQHIGKLSPKVGLQLFDSYILPILEYGSEIWATREYEILEKVQLKYLKMLLGVKNTTCSKAVLGEVGRFPLSLRQKISVVKYWISIKRRNVNDSSLPKKILVMLENLDNSGFVTWLSGVRRILEDYGLGKYMKYNTLTLEDEVECIVQLKEKVYGSYMEKWNKDIKQQPILRTYVSFKLDLRLEPYLLYIRDFKLRKAISKFRLSSHDFAIEKGRHCNPKIPADERWCTYCNQCIEDEKHVLLQCPRYAKDREVFFKSLELCNVLVNEDIHVAFIDILSCKDENVLFTLGKFLYKILKMRKLT